MAEFADTLRALVQTYRESLLLQEAGAVDPTRDTITQGRGGHSTHGERGRILSFGQDVPLSLRLERWLTGAAAYWRFELERETQGVERAELPAELVEMAAALNGIASVRHHPGGRANGGKPSSGKRAEDRQVLATKGDAMVVGLLFGRSGEAVRKLRERHDQEPHTGERVSKRAPLTSRDLPEED